MERSKGVPLYGVDEPKEPMTMEALRGVEVFRRTEGMIVCVWVSC
jgi:hypothetical protein